MILTDRLNIHPLEEKNLYWLKNIRNNPDTWIWLTDVVPVNDVGQEKWYTNISYDKSKMYLAIDIIESNKFIGIVRADEWDRINKSIRIGVDIDPLDRGNGYGTEALAGFINYLFMHLNMHRIWLMVLEDNVRGIHIYEKLGFKFEGLQREAIFRNGKYNNYLMYSILDWEYFCDNNTEEIKKEKKVKK